MTAYEAQPPIHTVQCDGPDCPAEFTPPKPFDRRFVRTARNAARDAGWDVPPPRGKGSRRPTDFCPACRARRELIARNADGTLDGYVSAVMLVLGEEFPNLTSAKHTADVVADAIRQHALKPSNRLEVIVDSPTLANWRLTADRERPGRVRLACYRLPDLVTEEDDERERRVNETLRWIP